MTNTELGHFILSHISDTLVFLEDPFFSDHRTHNYMLIAIFSLRWDYLLVR